MKILRFGVIAGIVLALVGCESTSTPPPQSAVYTIDVRPLRQRLKVLEEKGAAEVLPQQFIEVKKAVEGVRDTAGFQAARQKLEGLEHAVVTRASEEFTRARKAYESLKGDIRRLSRAIDEGAGCPDAAETLDELQALRRDLYAILRNLDREDLSTAIGVQRRCREARPKIAGVLARAAVCGTLSPGPDSGKDLLGASKKLSEDGHYGKAAEVLAMILSLAPDSEEATEARRRMEGLAETQKILATSVEGAISKCNSERAASELSAMEDLLRAFSEKAPDLVDSQVSRQLSKLQKDFRRMGRKCGKKEPEKPPVESRQIPVEVVSVERLINSGKLEDARVGLSSINDSVERNRLQSLIEGRQGLLDAEQAMDAGDSDLAAELALKAWNQTGEARAVDILSAVLKPRMEDSLASGRLADARRDVEILLAATPGDREVKGLAGRTYAETGRRAMEEGNSAEAIRWYSKSLGFRESPETRMALARLLAAAGREADAREQMEKAIRKGAKADAATRLQVMVVGPLIRGETDKAWAALEEIAGEGGGEDAASLMVHALRLPLSRELTRAILPHVGEGRLLHGADGIIVFAGRNTGLMEGEMLQAAEQALGGTVGLSSDRRYMAFAAGGGVVVYDGRAGKAFSTVKASGSGASESLHALARTELARAAAPFLTLHLEEILNSDSQRREKEDTIEEELGTLLGLGFDYVALADAKGTIRYASGILDVGMRDESLDVFSLRTARMKTADIEGRSYLELVAPLKIRGVVQVAMRAGFLVDLEELRSLIRRTGEGL